MSGLGLGLGPRAFEALVAALDRAVVDAASAVDPGRLAAFLRRHAIAIADEVSQTVSRTPDVSESPQRTVPEAAARLGVSVQMVRRLCATGQLPGAVRSRTGRGQGWSIPAEALERKQETNV